MKAIFIDDSLIVLQTLKRLLADVIEKYDLECSYYSDSKSVNELIENEALEYDIMFVDINMPDIDGYTLAINAKKKSKYKDRPIVAITTEYTNFSKINGIGAGIDEWLVKSIADDSLQNSIEALLMRLEKR